MKRKPISMKALYEYASEYLTELYEFEKTGKAMEEVEQSLELKHITEFLDYIWRNPK
jgi:hypothetical protein